MASTSQRAVRNGLQRPRTPAARAGRARAAKRALDIVLAGIALLVFAPIMVLITVAICSVLAGRAVVRPGTARSATGEGFRCWKFRSMHRDAEEILAARSRALREVRRQRLQAELRRRPARHRDRTGAAQDVARRAAPAHQRLARPDEPGRAASRRRLSRSNGATGRGARNTSRSDRASPGPGRSAAATTSATPSVPCSTPTTSTRGASAGTSASSPGPRCPDPQGRRRVALITEPRWNRPPAPRPEAVGISPPHQETDASQAPDFGIERTTSLARARDQQGKMEGCKAGS